MTDRGTGEAVGTILALVTLLLFAGASLPALDLVTDAAAVGQQHQLNYHAQQLAFELETVDRLVRRSDSPGTIGRFVDLPDRVGGERYTITIAVEDAHQTVSLRTDSGSAAARARFRTETPVDPITLHGGPIDIVRDNGSVSIAVRPEGAR